jgi:hypothetical protein
MTIFPSFSSTVASTFASHYGQRDVVVNGAPVGSVLIGAPVRVVFTDEISVAI